MTSGVSVPQQDQHYDIVIAGGGTAGCVLAARLSEDPDCKVLLLEAGGNNNDDPRVKIPALFGQCAGDAKLDWNYKTVPQAHLNGRSVVQPRGKGLGGSSMINVLGLVYPARTGFDAWAEMGNKGWDWDSMLPYLKKFQTFHPPDSDQVIADLHLSYIDKETRKTNGPIQASYIKQPHPLHKAWVDTFKTMGYNTKLDLLSGDLLGGYQIVNVVDPVTQERSHSGNAYLDMAKSRPNLKIITDAVIEKIVLSDDKVPVATGVSAQVGSVKHTFHAKKEVILCAGTYGSPSILERSGVGNPDLLQQLGVKCVVDNKNVGENLQDHILCAVSFELVDGIETFDDFQNPAFVEAAMKQYQHDRTGPMTWTCPSFAYMPLVDPHNANAFLDISDLLKKYLTPNGTNGATDNLDDFDKAYVAKILSSPNEASGNFCTTLGQAHAPGDSLGEIFGPSEPGHYITFWTALCHPLSRGNVHIPDTNPLSMPIIDPKYYSHPLDSEVMSRHVQLYDCIANTEPMKSIVKKDGNRFPADAKFDTLEDTAKLVRNNHMSNYHPAGTCAMRPRGKGGVVDDRLRVYGVNGLRICDASIMPIITKGNLMASVYAIAEKAADLVKEDLAHR